MSAFVSILLFIWLLIGMMSPKVAFFNKLQNASRWHVWLVFGVLWILNILIASGGIDREAVNEGTVKSVTSRIEKGEFESAQFILKSLTDTGRYAAIKDSLQLEIEKGIKKKDSLAVVEHRDNLLASGREAIEAIKDHRKNGKKYSDYLDAAVMTGSFAHWQNLVDSLNSLGGEGVKLAKQLDREQSSFAYQEWPKIRKAVANHLRNKYWEVDIDVQVRGKRNQIIRFIGGAFAANRNIKQVQDDWYKTLKIARFTRSEFLWYKGADEYTYFNIYKGSDRDRVVVE